VRAKSARWIQGPTRDLALLVATPLWILPLAAVRPPGLEGRELAALVLAFGAMGHHLPGMLRAYGDRALFARFRTRLVAAPALFVAAGVGSALLDLHGLAWIALVWGLWHGLAQLYGFARIYDAKAGCDSRATARLDLALCVAWFGAGVLFSPGRAGELVEKAYAAGFPLLPGEPFETARALFAAATAAVTAAYLANAAARLARGLPQSGIKHLQLALGLGFWWIAMVAIDDVILGVALFEVFHDVQYVTITWIYNRRVVEGGSAVGGLLRFLFRRSGALLGLYLGFVFAYGGVALVGDALRDETLRRAVAGLVLSSALLHFYLDGFLWKVRERETRAGLGIEGGPAAAARAPGALRHAALWLLFLAPLGALAARELRGVAPPLERARAVALASPRDDVARLRAGDALLEMGRLREARAEYERARELRPRAADAHRKLGDLHARASAWSEAERAYRAALALAPGDPVVLHNLAGALRAQGRLDEAEASLAAALRADPDYEMAHASLGALRHARGDLRQARARYERALALDPDLLPARHNLALLLEAEGRHAEAAREREAAARLRGRRPPPPPRAPSSPLLRAP
jgi:tetratricopeptide (TPR) repeat protein